MLHELLLALQTGGAPAVAKSDIEYDVPTRSKAGASAIVVFGKYHGAPVVVKEFKAGSKREKVWAECNLQYGLGKVPLNHVLSPTGFVSWRESEVVLSDNGAETTKERDRYGICFPRGFALSEVLCWIREGRLTRFDFNSRLRWAQTVAEGVAHLHNDGVTHRDLKPPNIIVMITAAAAEGAEPHSEIYLTDFGCAKATELISQSGAVPGQVGTLQYMSPEVLGNEPREYMSVDVYALSMVSWEILSAEVPFGSDIPEPALRMMVRRGERPYIRPDWPHAVQTAIRRGWAADAAERGTAEKFADALRSAMPPAARR
jgi:tRNA A-37 threonylcarbamoyl transferase component Bud32